MGKSLIWIIAIIVLNAVIAALGKKAQANAQAAKQGGAVPAGSPESQSTPRVFTRGAGKPKAPTARGARPPAPPVRVPPVAPEEDSSAALQSRQRLLEQVAKVKAAEARVAQASGIRADHSAVTRPVLIPKPALGSADIRRALRDPADIRKALILGEILGRPRGA